MMDEETAKTLLEKYVEVKTEKYTEIIYPSEITDCHFGHNYPGRGFRFLSVGTEEEDELAFEKIIKWRILEGGEWKE